MSHVPTDLFDDSDDHRFAEKLIRKLGNNCCDPDNPVSVRTLMTWLRDNVSQRAVKRILRQLIADERTPVEGDVEEEVYLSIDYFHNPGSSTYGN